MANYAIHDGATVTNVVVAATQEIAEAVTGMNALETTGEPWIGWTLIDGEWTAPITEDAEASTDDAEAAE